MAAFFAGLAGSLHCLGMCGPLVLAYSLHAKGAARGAKPGAASSGACLRYHLAFHAGRLITYTLMGAAAAGLFQAAELSRFTRPVRQLVWLAGGAVLILAGLAMLKVLPVPRLFAGWSQQPGPLFLSRVRNLLQSPRPVSKIGLGMAAGLLPCGLSWAMVVAAASSQRMADGFCIMAAFGLGTVPALLAAGMSASFLSLRTRLLGQKAAALCIAAMGLLLILKGTGVLM
jgi:uncharacterized protein